MLNRYLHRLYDTIISRGYVQVERLDFDELPGRQGIVEGRLRFHDGSLLDFDEVVLLRSEQIVKLRYAYHYQTESGEVIFRYDNAHIIQVSSPILTTSMLALLSSLHKLPISAKFSMKLSK